MKESVVISTISLKRGWFYYALPLLLLCLVPFEGWWFGGDKGNLFTNLFALILCVLLARYFAFTRFSAFVFCISLLLLSSVFVNSYISLYSNIQKDILFYLKSLVFGGVVYSFFYRSPVNCDAVFIRGVSLFCWSVITIAIVLSDIFGFGFYTYEEFGAGSKFYFPSVNEVNFVYFVFNFMVWSFYRSFLLRFSVFFVGIMIYLIIGNKSFIALYFISVLSFLFLLLPFWGRLFCLFLCAVVVSIFVVFPDLLTAFFSVFFQALSFVFSGFSGGAEKFIVKASYLSPFSALVSERDVLYLLGHDIFFSSLDILRLFIGMSYGVYGSLYAARRGGEFSFSEIDPVDLFFSYGLIGAFLMMVIFVGLLSRKVGGWSRPRSILILLFFCAGLMTGHIYGFVFPVFFFAMYLGLLTPRL